MSAVSVVHYTIDDELHRRVKVAAAKKGITLRAYLVAALEQAVARDEEEEEQRDRREGQDTS
jgi:hypothetical protein